jgi:hypothetical protein
MIQFQIMFLNHKNLQSTQFDISEPFSIEVEFEITAVTSGTVGVSLATGVVTGDNFSTVGVKRTVGVATSNSVIYFKSVNFAGTIENVSVRLADEDRSHNANPVAVHGTVPRTPVATGSELVAYGPFTASNYLEQPYNADLDFGTGDFSIMGWVKSTGLNDTIFDSRDQSGQSGVQLKVNISGIIELSTFASGASCPMAFIIARI